MTLELGLALWGAAVATVLAVKEVLAALRDQPNIEVFAGVVYGAAKEGEAAHGVSYLDTNRHQPMWIEADVEFNIRNRGQKACQVTHVVIGDEKTTMIVAPSPLPIVLEPYTAVRVRVQPEMFAMRNAVDISRRSDPPEFMNVKHVGVLTALGDVAYLDRRIIPMILDQCRALPLRFTETTTHEPGRLGFLLQLQDPMQSFDVPVERIRKR